jgi:hypothetical protein
MSSVWKSYGVMAVLKFDEEMQKTTGFNEKCHNCYVMLTF